MAASTQGKLALSKSQLSRIPGAEERIFGKLDELLDAMLALALGHKLVITKFDQKSGQVISEVWDQDPDYKALAFLIENVIGKVPSRVELTGADGGAVKIIPWMTMDEAQKMGLRADLSSPDEDRRADPDDEPIDAEFEELAPAQPTSGGEHFDVT